MIFKDERTIIILFIYFFRLENIRTKISSINEQPYKMAKPASLYSGYHRVFFPRLRLDASVSARGRQIFGRRPVDLGSRRSQFKDLSETGNRAWKISGTHGRKRYKDVKKNNCLNTRIQRCVWLTVLQTRAWETASVAWIRKFCTKKHFTKVNLPYTG